jgi:hypothetical protein
MDISWSWDKRSLNVAKIGNSNRPRNAYIQGTQRRFNRLASLREILKMMFTGSAKHEK